MGLEETRASVRSVFDVAPICHPPPPEAPASAAWQRHLPARALLAEIDTASQSTAALTPPDETTRRGAGRELQQRKGGPKVWRRRRQIQPGITEAGIQEIGPQREKMHAWRAGEIQKSMAANLRETGWLGEYVPMRMNCPLLGRRVSAEAVSDFAAQVWTCDGLGFGAECLWRAEE